MESVESSKRRKEPSEKQLQARFKPGVSGNPGGRPSNPFKHAGVAMRVIESFADRGVLDDPDWRPSTDRQLRGLEELARTNRDVQKELAKHYFVRAFKELDRAEDGEGDVDADQIVERVLSRFRGAEDIFALVLKRALEDPMLVPAVCRAVTEAAFSRPAVMQEITGRLGVRAPVVLESSPIGGDESDETDGMAGTGASEDTGKPDEGDGSA